MTQRTPSQSRAAALLLLALLLAAVVLAVATPVWLLNRRYDGAIEDASARLVRYAKVAGMRDGLQKKAVEVRALDGTSHYLRSATPAVAAAELQEIVRGILDANGGKLISIQILPHKDDGLYRQVAVNLQMTTTLTALKPILHQLESARPYLFIDNFSVRAPFGFGQRPATPAEPELVVQFDLTGYAVRSAP